MRKSLLSLFVLGVAAAGAPAQITRSGAGYLMRVKYVKGQVIRLNTTNSMSGLSAAGGPKGATQFQTPIALTVLSSVRNVSTIQLKMGAVKYGTSVVNPGQTAVVTL